MPGDIPMPASTGPAPAVVGANKCLRDLGNGFYAEVVSLPGALPAVVVANAVFDARVFGDIEFQFTTGTVSVTRSLDGVTYVPWPVYDKLGNLGTGTSNGTAGTPDIWSTDGGGYLKFSDAVTARGGA